MWPVEIVIRGRAADRQSVSRRLLSIDQIGVREVNQFQKQQNETISTKKRFEGGCAITDP